MFLTVQIYSTGNFRIQLTGLFISIAAILVSQILFDIRNFQRVGTVLGQMEFAITATLNCTDISITDIRPSCGFLFSEMSIPPIILIRVEIAGRRLLS